MCACPESLTESTGRIRLAGVSGKSSGGDVPSQRTATGFCVMAASLSSRFAGSSNPKRKYQLSKLKSSFLPRVCFRAEAC